MRRSFKKICAALLTAVVVTGTANISQLVVSEAATTANETKLNITSKKAGVGVTKENRITLQLKNPTGNVTWKSSNENLVKVYPKTNGKAWVYTSNYGDGKTVKVTATDKNGTYTCKVTPKKPSETEPFFSYTTYTGKVGDTVDLTVYNYSGKITWKRSNTCAVVAKTGKTTLKKAGTVKITATLEDGTVLTCTIKVTKADSTSKPAASATPTPKPTATPTPTPTPKPTATPTPTPRIKVENISGVEVTMRGNDYLDVKEFAWYIRGGYLHCVIALNNTNSKYAIEFPTFRVTAYDANNKVMGTEEQVLSLLYPNQEFVCNQLLFEVDEEPSKIKVTLLEPDKYNILTPGKLDYKTHIQMVGQNLSVMDDLVTGEIYNPNDYDVESAWVTVIFRNDEGEIIFGENTFVHQIYANDAVPFEIDIYTDIELPEECEVYAYFW